MSVEKEEILTDPVRQIICAKCGKPLDVAGLTAFSKFRCGHCQAVQTVPAKLGNFILLELLGRGGMGAVYRAVDQSLGRPVAIKVMLRAVAEDRLFFDQFKREARAAAALSHPNIVQIYSLDEDKGQSYIVMELLSGGRLDHLISSKKRLDEASVLKIGLEVAEGLNAAGRVGLIHDDIKPENILFDGKGVAKIVDFGLARYRGKGGPQSAQNEIWGTPYYIAPEKVTRQPPDLRSDIYSLGATLFHALAGRPPFEGVTAVDVVKARLQGPAPDVRTFRPEVKPGLAAILARMLEQDPQKRYQTYPALMGEMGRLAGEALKTPGVDASRGKSSKILIKGKKQSTVFDPGDAPAASEAVSAPKDGEVKPKRNVGKIMLMIIGLAILLGGLTAGMIVMVQRKQAQTRIERDQSRLGKLKTQASGLMEDIRTSANPVLSEADRFFFYDLEAAVHLARAREIIAQLGDAAKWVTLPAIPSDQDVADRMAAPVTASFGNLTNLEALCAEAEQLYAQIEKEDTPSGNVAEQKVNRLVEIQRTINALAPALGGAQKLAAKVIPEAQEWVKAAEETRVAAEKAADEEAKNTEAQRKREAEEAEKKRLADEKAAKIEAELGEVRQAWTGVQDLIRQNQYAGAVETLKKSLSRLQTEEGKTEAKNALDRCLYLQEMKDFLIEALQAKPLRWGWFSPSGQIDISGASEKGILVRDKIEPWTAVDARQMLKFMDAYVKSEETREKKGKRVWTRLQLGAAVYCYIQGERAYSVARGYADVAVQNDYKLETEVKRLMPELPKGGG